MTCTCAKTLSIRTSHDRHGETWAIFEKGNTYQFSFEEDPVLGGMACMRVNGKPLLIYMDEWFEHFTQADLP